MQNKDIHDLLNKYREGNISEQELKLLENWYSIYDPEILPLSHEELAEIKGEVWQSVSKSSLNQVKKQLWPRIAAAASLLLIITLSAYYLTHRAVPSTALKPTVAFNKAINDFKPGGNRATLTLSNGKQIILTGAENGKLATQGAIAINKTSDGQVVYGVLGGAKINGIAEVIYNTMSTPRGGQYNLTLSDGTKVWLNAASSITYPVAFSNNEREVTVSGEAYFEVAHNKNKPFKVMTGNQEITVLGTHFNVKAYADDAGISTTLLTGSIRLKNLRSGESLMIDPGQQAKIFKDNDEISIKKVNPEDAISWKNGYFLFDNQEIKSIMKIMSRWYDVDIEYENTRKHDRFGGTFSRSSNMSEILNNLEHVGKIHFKIKDKKVIVTD